MGKIVKEVSQYFSVDEKIILSRLENHDKYYREVLIPKKSGGKREIHFPSVEIKAIQYFILEKYLSDIEVSDCATAYKKNTSILDNVSIHLGNKHFLKIDLKDFFDSLNYETAKKILTKFFENDLNEDDVEEILQFTTYKNRFIQGAVTSPAISNILFKEIDDAIVLAVSDLSNVRYSRYSDDIIISSLDLIPDKVLETISDILKNYGFRINPKKTYFTSNPNIVKITGLNIVGYDKVKVGTKYKKEIKNMIYHKLKYGEESKDSCEKIIGKLMFLKYVEPDYYNFLNIKYMKNKVLLIDVLKNLNKEEIKKETYN